MDRNVDNWGMDPGMSLDNSGRACAERGEGLRGLSTPDAHPERAGVHTVPPTGSAWWRGRTAFSTGSTPATTPSDPPGEIPPSNIISAAPHRAERLEGPGCARAPEIRGITPLSFVCDLTPAARTAYAEARVSPFPPGPQSPSSPPERQCSS